ncbi:MAG: hypothetical protein SW019_11975 [Actinomycetota bacterium]|uniref:Uncharacterized protein n=1 Tax=Mycolicibacterium gadium TaxID=1794 RepID=A0ABT6H0V3_MYCGU|nr:hypothetical protein [Mycolicibacterium gadium]MDG5486921.1 hypothetical protein [Mycolicibacterium gadium]MDY6997310.1 hypothetical protein [Actinomycetota bacterium]
MTQRLQRRTIPAAAGCAARIATDVCSLLGNSRSSIGGHPECFACGGVDDGFDRSMKCHRRGASSQKGSFCRELLLESVNLLVSVTVDRVESLAAMPDQLGGLFDRFGHISVQIGMIGHRLGRAVGALAHRFDHLA